MNIKQSIPASKRNKLEKGNNIIIETSVSFNSITELNSMKALLIAKHGLKELMLANPSVKLVVNLKLQPCHITGIENGLNEIKERLESFLNEYNELVVLANTTGFYALKISKEYFNNSLDENGEIVKKDGYKIAILKKELNIFKETNLFTIVDKVTSELNANDKASEKINSLLANHRKYKYCCNATNIIFIRDGFK